MVISVISYCLVQIFIVVFILILLFKTALDREVDQFSILKMWHDTLWYYIKKTMQDTLFIIAISNLIMGGGGGS